ncbi:unnamed protein product [Staurois parvus]|uniref:Uncharacterized protein n=1 Tax=Staurois parvus TaxID=386267 RepID=A0ABN9GB80_9NEOB|nr:unnamed protein product [Staurois parvus]
MYIQTQHIYTQTHVRTYTQTHTHVHTDTCTHTHTYMYIHADTCTDTHMHIHADTCTDTYMHIHTPPHKKLQYFVVGSQIWVLHSRGRQRAQHTLLSLLSLRSAIEQSDDSQCQ